MRSTVTAQRARRLDRAGPSLWRNRRTLRDDAGERDGAPVGRTRPGLRVRRGRRRRGDRAGALVTAATLTLSTRPASSRPDGIGHTGHRSARRRDQRAEPGADRGAGRGGPRRARTRRLKGLVVASGKPDQWVAGADLKIITQAATRTTSRPPAAAFKRCATSWPGCRARRSPRSTDRRWAAAWSWRWRATTASPPTRRASRVGQPEVSLGLSRRRRHPALAAPGRPAAGAGPDPERPPAERAPRAAARAWSTRSCTRRCSSRPRARGRHEAETPARSAAEDGAESRGGNGHGRADAGRTPAHVSPGARRRSWRARTGTTPRRCARWRRSRPASSRAWRPGWRPRAERLASWRRPTTARNLIWLFMATQRQKRLVATRAHDASRPVWAWSAPASWARRSPKWARLAGCAVRVQDIKPEAVGQRPGAIRTHGRRRRQAAALAATRGARDRAARLGHHRLQRLFHAPTW